MSLDKKQIEILERSITSYDFPASYYDFDNISKVTAANMTEVESVISAGLYSNSLIKVRHGLANVVYWGNANAGYQMHRTKKSIIGTTDEQLLEFQRLVANRNVPSLMDIKLLGMPQFSGISFISKIVTFLDPNKFCVLDNLIARLAGLSGNKALHSLKSWTGIPVSKNNITTYNRWCNECATINEKYFQAKYRAVDIERGFFSLIQHKELQLAQIIYRDA